jgi:hypothetical protein
VVGVLPADDQEGDSAMMNRLTDRLTRRHHRYILPNGGTLTVRRSGWEWCVEVHGHRSSDLDAPVYFKCYMDESDALKDACTWLRGEVI